MMEDKNNYIDDIFKEGLSDMRVEPSRGLWAKILNGLSIAGVKSVMGGTGLYLSIFVGVITVSTLVYSLVFNDSDHEINSNPRATEVNELKSIQTEYATNELVNSSVNSNNDIPTQVLADDLPSEPAIHVDADNNLKTVDYSNESDLMSVNSEVESIVDVDKISKNNFVTGVALQKVDTESEIEVKTDERVPALKKTTPLRNEGFKIGNLFADLGINKKNYQYESLKSAQLFSNYIQRGLVSVSGHYQPEYLFIDGVTEGLQHGAGVDLNWAFKDISIHCGVEVSKSSDAGEFLLSFSSNDSVGFYNHVNSFVYDESSNTFEYDTEVRNVYEIKEHQDVQEGRRDYYFINVPVLLGRELYYYKRFKLLAKTGVVLNYKISETTTSYNTPSETIGNVLVENNIRARSKTNWFLHGSIQSEYLIHHNVSCVIEPTFRYYVKKTWQGEDNINNPYSLSLRMGLKYYF
jgi:hypothetical protein